METNIVVCDRIPDGVFCGDDAVPPGTFHGGDTVVIGTFHGGDAVPPGTFHGDDAVPPGTFHSEKDVVPPGTFHGTVYYRTQDGRADYGFSVERQGNGTYRPYITSQPGYAGRADDPHSTHRNSDGDRKYVCWTHALRSEGEAQQVAAKWADATQQYIGMGRKF